MVAAKNVAVLVAAVAEVIAEAVKEAKVWWLGVPWVAAKTGMEACRLVEATTLGLVDRGRHGWILSVDEEGGEEGQ